MSPAAREARKQAAAALRAYRKADVDVYYQPAADNDLWFTELMTSYGIKPASENPHTPGKLTVLMVND